MRACLTSFSGFRSYPLLKASNKGSLSKRINAATPLDRPKPIFVALCFKDCDESWFRSRGVKPARTLCSHCGKRCRVSIGSAAQKLYVTPCCIESCFFHASILEVEFVFPRSAFTFYELSQTQGAGGSALAYRLSEAAEAYSNIPIQTHRVRRGGGQVPHDRNHYQWRSVLPAIALFGSEVEAESDSIICRAVVSYEGKGEMRRVTRLVIECRGHYGHQEH